MNEPYYQPAAVRQVAPSAVPSKSKPVAVLLAWLFGHVGAHSFYLGRPRVGIAHCVLVLAGLGLVVLGRYVDNFVFVVAGIGAILLNYLWAVIELALLAQRPSDSFVWGK